MLPSPDDHTDFPLQTSFITLTTLTQTPNPPHFSREPGSLTLSFHLFLFPSNPISKHIPSFLAYHMLYPPLLSVPSPSVDHTDLPLQTPFPSGTHPVIPVPKSSRHSLGTYQLSLLEKRGKQVSKLHIFTIPPSCHVQAPPPDYSPNL